MRFRHIASTGAAAALVLGISATSTPSHASGSCSGSDYYRVKNVSCATAKQVIDAALGHVGVDYAFTVQGFHCHFPGRDAANGISCHRSYKGKKQTIFWAGD